MAKRQRVRPKNGLKTSDQIAVPVSSGYTVLVERPPMNFVRAVMTKAEELHPYPEKPVAEEIKTLTGDVVTVVNGDDAAYTAAKELADAKRNEYLLEYAFSHRLEVEGYEAEDAKQELISQYASDRAEMEEFGSLPDDMKVLDDWQFVLRVFVVADGADYAAIMFAVMQAFDQEAITPDEIRQRVRFL